MAKQPKNVEFVWEGKNKRGQKVKGELSGPNMAVVKAQLRKQGILPEKVKRAPKPLMGGSQREENPNG